MFLVTVLEKRYSDIRQVSRNFPGWETQLSTVSGFFFFFFALVRSVVPSQGKFQSTVENKYQSQCTYSPWQDTCV